MTRNELRITELLVYVRNPFNQIHFPRCCASRARELKKYEYNIKDTEIWNEIQNTKDLTNSRWKW